MMFVGLVLGLFSLMKKVTKSLLVGIDVACSVCGCGK